MVLPKISKGFPGKKNSVGFTIIEMVIAMFILAVFLLPLMQHFTRTRRVSLAARDAVIVNSFQASCVDELRLVGYKDLLSKATSSRLIQEKYSGEKRINKLNIQTIIEINKGTEPKLVTIDVKSTFRLPGSGENVPKRKVSMRGFAYAEP
ncbi:MAG: prepilin-type N-terminal cleavage/methylation domain-containing protein [Candidatus Ozemobacteraceae bacterium]